MINLRKINSQRINKNKVDLTYNQNFKKAQVNLEIFNADAHISDTTKEMLEQTKA